MDSSNNNVLKRVKPCTETSPISTKKFRRQRYGKCDLEQQTPGCSSDTDDLTSTPECPDYSSLSDKASATISKEETTSNDPGCRKDDNTDDIDSLKRAKSQIEERIRGKEEQLRKLQMVKMYRSKNNLQELDTLISKWQEVSRDAMEELLDLNKSETSPTLAQLITHLGIDPALLDFPIEDQT